MSRPVSDAQRKPKEIRRKTHLIRLDNVGELDELFASNVSVHLERMSGNAWWMGIDLPNGNRIHLRFGCVTKRAKLALCLSEDPGDDWQVTSNDVDADRRRA